MRFTKMHGLGNDYVFVNCFDQAIDDPAALAQTVSDRHFGVGGDGLILITPSSKADAGMRIFNADGSEAEMCGNGVRCVAKYMHDNQLVQSRPPVAGPGPAMLRRACPEARDIGEIIVETGRGVLTLYLALVNALVEQVCVNMGEPILFPGDIPVNVIGQQAAGIPFSVEGRDLLLTAVSMGNPHAVFYVPDVAAVELERIGPIVENHKMFPQRTNVHFVQVVGPQEVIMRTWERGSGITLACGTGASAVCVAGILASKTEPEILAHLPGGDLQLQWNPEDNHVYMAGPATLAFTGDWPGR